MNQYFPNFCEKVYSRRQEFEQRKGPVLYYTESPAVVFLYHMSSTYLCKLDSSCWRINAVLGDEIGLGLFLENLGDRMTRSHVQYFMDETQGDVSRERVDPDSSCLCFAVALHFVRSNSILN